jgi:DUF971 family protein
MNLDTNAKDVTINLKEQILTIIWGDDHQSTYTLYGLRKSCPCADCRGGHAKMGDYPQPQIFTKHTVERLSVSQIQPVGNYALQIFWGDGHNAGFYAWDMLRSCCPCETCTRKWKL